MILLQLFLTFLKIGTLAFGGGYGMLAFMIDECLAHGWLTMDEVLNFIAVAESMPGPIAVDMATFIGSSLGGLLGAILSVIAVVFTSFVLMLIVAKFFKNFINYPVIRKTLNCIQPVVIGIILATATSFLLTEIFNISTIHSIFTFNWKSVIILGIIIATAFGFKKLRKQTISPILLIIVSGILGVLFFGL